MAVHRTCSLVQHDKRNLQLATCLLRPEGPPVTLSEQSGTLGGAMNQMQEPRKHSVLLYRDGNVTVTTTWFVSATGGRYRVDELACLVEARGAPHTGVVVSLATAATTALGVIASAVLAGSSIPLTVGGFAVLVPVGIAVLCAYRWPPSSSLRARYHGFDVELFHSRDVTLFRKVSRALVRAQEINQAGLTG
jgi:hypothetical protein